MNHDAARIQEFAKRLRSLKGDGPMTTLNTGTASFINGTFFRGLMDDTVSLSKWLRAGAHMIEVDPGQESIQVGNWDDVRWTHIPDADEGDPTAFDATVRPTYREVLIACQHMGMEMELSMRNQKKVKARLNADLRRESEVGFATALGNNMARSFIRGDVTSADPSLNGFDGLRVRAAAQGRVVSLADNVGGVLVATAFDPNTAFQTALLQMPEGLRTDKLRWYGHNNLWLEWMRWLQASGTAERTRDGLARDALVDGVIPPANGYLPLQIPQWPADEGPQGVPDAVADDGDGTMTIRVNVILPDLNDYSGRRVRVTYLPNGEFENLTVAQPVVGQNAVETAGSLGQPAAALDVVAANYTVEVIDETTLMLVDPYNCLLPVENEMLAIKSFEGRGLTYNDIVHAFMDSRLLRPDAVVLLTGIWVQG